MPKKALSGLSISILLAVALVTAIAPASLLSARADQSTPPPDQPSLNDYWVVRAYYTDQAQIDQLASWTEPWEVNREGGYIVLGVGPAEYNLLVVSGFRVEIDQEMTDAILAPREPNEGGGIPGFPCYRTVEETFSSAALLAATYPDFATWIDIGNSWEKTNNSNEGYDMMVLRITNSAMTDPKPKLFIMAGLHAREYAPPEIATRFAEYLLANYAADPDVTWLLDYHEIHLLLHSNPDGRKQAETGLLWRKNTNENYCSPTSNLRGADLNRNFDFKWGCCGGSSGNECSEIFRGESPASEPETQAIQDYVASIIPDQRGPGDTDPAPLTTTGVFLDIHSFGELILWPWGWTAGPAPNASGLQTLGRKMGFYNTYFPQQAVQLYVTDGSSKDWAYGELGIPGYTIEVGNTFFESCTSFQNSVYPENLPALIYAAKTSRTPYMTTGGPEALNVAVSQAIVTNGIPVTITATINDTRFNNQNGTEPTQNIVAAEYYFSVPDWVTTTTPLAVAMAPIDGTFNSKIEGVEGVLDTTSLPIGRHLIYVRGKDAAGNWGVVSAVFLTITDDKKIYLPIIRKSPEP